MGSHGGDLPENVIGFLAFAVFGVVVDRGLLGETVRTFLRERGPGEVGSKTFHGTAALLLHTQMFSVFTLFRLFSDPSSSNMNP